MRWNILVVVLVCLISEPSIADQISKDAKLTELMQRQGLVEIIEQQRAYGQEQAKKMAPRIMEEFKKNMPEINSDVLDEINAAASQFVDSLKVTWTTDEAVKAWAEYYGEQVSEDEVDQILAYYKSSAGQKDVMATKKAMPELYAFFQEKNRPVLDAAINTYMSRLKEIAARANAKKKAS